MVVCIVEDDARLAALLQQALEEEDAAVTLVSSGEGAAGYIVSHSFDAVVLDLGLPGMGGLEVLAQIRRARCHTPVLVLSAQDTVPVMVRALDMGADDYITKPFHLEIFLARLRSVSRRGVAPQLTDIVRGPVTLQPSKRTAYVSGQPVELTRREFMLLETLIRRSGQVVTRDQLAEAVWGFDAEVSKSNLDYHIHSLRAKLGAPCQGMLRTIRGTGYMLVDEAPAA